MKTAVEYRLEKEKLLSTYETRVREWLKSNDAPEYIADNIPYYRDGVVCPEVWFSEGNDFRPLFVLKEVSLGTDTVDGLKKYNETWGNQRSFEFVENPFDDIQVGTFSQWKRVATLAKGLEDIHRGCDESDYYGSDKDFSFIPGDVYAGHITGYNDSSYSPRNGNKNYNDIIKKIAVLELKKVGGGTAANTELSIATKYYTEHIAPFEDLLLEQIRLIDPTVIICLGRENGQCTRYLLKNIEALLKDIIWIDGYHHIMSSNEKFYYGPLREYKQQLRNHPYSVE